MKTLLALITLLACGGAFAHAAETKPNILVLLSDDLGWGDFQCYNPHGKIPTPNVDRLAREGMRFTHAHSGGAVCSPTRYSMLTGNYPWRGKNPTGWPTKREGCQIRPGQKTVAALLREVGYRTAMFGKSHIGHVFGQTPAGELDVDRPMTDGPVQWGFDFSCILPTGHILRDEPGIFFTNGVRDAGMKFDLHTLDETLLHRALGFLDEHLAKNKAGGGAQPFYIHFCSIAAHEPFTPPVTLDAKPVAGVTKLGEHADFVYEVDVLAGAWRAALEKRGLLENTLFVVTSDNGGKPEEIELGHDSVGGLRGKKHLIAEGGHRVPFVALWPGKIPAGKTLAQPIATHDLVATALELAGVAVPAGQCLDSTSLVPLLLGQRDDATPIRQHLLAQGQFDRGGAADDTESDEGEAPKKVKGEDRRSAKKRVEESANHGLAFAVYDRDWKLIMDANDKPAALFDLAADLGEKRDLHKDPAHAERVQRMFTAYRAIRESSPPTPNPTALKKRK